MSIAVPPISPALTGTSDDALVLPLAPAAKVGAVTHSESPPKKIRPIEEDMPAHEFSVTRITDLEQLADYSAAWNRLAEVCVSPNAMQMPWFLGPALRHLAGSQALELLLVEAPTRVNPQGKKVLCGLFPFVRRRSFYLLPVSCLELWQHPYGFLNTPLIRRDCVREVLATLFHFARTSPHGAPLIHFPLVDAEGPFHQTLLDETHREQNCVFVRDLFSRALFRRDRDAESFLKNNISRKKRQEAQRLERRLAELGRLEARSLTNSAELEAWVESFLRLEAAGWKGQEGTALASDPAHAAFFRTMARAAFDAGGLQMFEICFNDQPIAMICNLLAADGGYGFKIAYDESFAKFSPGVLLELEQIRRLHQAGIAWMDSCAIPDHPMINHYWLARTLRQSLVFSNGSWFGDLATSLLPLARWAKRYAFRSRKTLVSTSSQVPQ